MKMEIISLKCPSCNAAITANENDDSVVCEYCDTKILLRSEEEIAAKRKHEAELLAQKHEQEAKMKREEAERESRMREIEMQKRQASTRRGLIAAWIIISIILILIGLKGNLICFLIGAASFTVMGIIVKHKYDEKQLANGKLKIPSLVNVSSDNYAAVAALFTSAGFKNVKCVPLKDLIAGILEKPGMVSKITINGKEVISGGGWVSADSLVTITYHSFR